MTTTDERPALNQAAIVAAARRIADAAGLPALTLRRLATEFGTGQASLYRHITNRAELLSLLADDLASGYPIVTSNDADQTSVVVRQWLAIHDQLAAHPWAARLIADGVHLGRGAEDVAAAVTTQLVQAGIDRDDATRAYQALWHLLLGHLLSSHPFGHPYPDAQHEPSRRRRVEGKERDAFSWALRRLLAGALSG